MDSQDDVVKAGTGAQAGQPAGEPAGNGQPEDKKSGQSGEAKPDASQKESDVIPASQYKELQKAYNQRDEELSNLRKRNEILAGLEKDPEIVKMVNDYFANKQNGKVEEKPPVDDGEDEMVYTKKDVLTLASELMDKKLEEFKRTDPSLLKVQDDLVDRAFDKAEESFPGIKAARSEITEYYKQNPHTDKNISEVYSILKMPELLKNMRKLTDDEKIKESLSSESGGASGSSGTISELPKNATWKQCIEFAEKKLGKR